MHARIEKQRQLALLAARTASGSPHHLDWLGDAVDQSHNVNQCNISERDHDQAESEKVDRIGCLNRPTAVAHALRHSSTLSAGDKKTGEIDRISPA